MAGGCKSRTADNWYCAPPVFWGGADFTKYSALFPDGSRTSDSGHDVLYPGSGSGDDAYGGAGRDFLNEE